MKQNWGWMGNVVMGEDVYRVKSYSDLPKFGLEIMLTCISGVQ